MLSDIKIGATPFFMHQRSAAIAALFDHPGIATASGRQLCSALSTRSEISLPDLARVSPLAKRVSRESPFASSNWRPGIFLRLGSDLNPDRFTMARRRFQSHVVIRTEMVKDERDPHFDEIRAGAGACDTTVIGATRSFAKKATAPIKMKL